MSDIIIVYSFEDVHKEKLKKILVKEGFIILDRNNFLYDIDPKMFISYMGKEDPKERLLKIRKSFGNFYFKRCMNL